MKKLLVLMIAAMLVAGGAGVALSKGSTASGEVTDVKGKTVTIELENGKLSKGDKVEIEVKEEKKAPKKKGGAMLMGC